MRWSCCKSVVSASLSHLILSRSTKQLLSTWRPVSSLAGSPPNSHLFANEHSPSQSSAPIYSGIIGHGFQVAQPTFTNSNKSHLIPGWMKMLVERHGVTHGRPPYPRPTTRSPSRWVQAGRQSLPWSNWRASDGSGVHWSHLVPSEWWCQVKPEIISL